MSTLLLTGAKYCFVLFDNLSYTLFLYYKNVIFIYLYTVYYSGYLRDFAFFNECVYRGLKIKDDSESTTNMMKVIRMRLPIPQQRLVVLHS